MTRREPPAPNGPLLNRLTFIYQNFGRIYTQGFELDAEQSITRQLRVSAAYTYLDAKDTGANRGLPQRHKHQGFVRTEYLNGAWDCWPTSAERSLATGC